MQQEYLRNYDNLIVISVANKLKWYNLQNALRKDLLNRL